MVICRRRSVDQSCIHHVVSLYSSLSLCSTTLELPTRGQRNARRKIRAGPLSLCLSGELKGIRQSVSYPMLWLTVQKAWGKSLEGSGRSNNSIWFCLLTCIPCSWLPIISPWVCASLLSVPYESVSSFFGVGVALCSVPRLVYGRGRKRWFSWGQDLSDLVLLLPYEVAGCLFLLRLAGTSLSAGVLISWKQDVEKAAAGGQDKTRSSKKLYLKRKVDFKLSVSLHVTAK